MSNHSQSSDNEEEDLTPIQYARLNGLSCDYLAEPMPLSHIDKLRKDTHDGLTDDSHLRQFNFEPELDTEERLSISKDAALLLASVAKEESVDWADSLVLSTLGSRDVKRMRVEEPFLKSDHKRDCKEFAKREGFEIKLKDVKLPSEIVNEENDEGLGWPSKFWSLGAEVMENLKQEKITVQRDTLVYLQNTLKATWTEEDGIGLWNRELKYKRVGENITSLVTFF
jgi:hypothetical protein